MEERAEGTYEMLWDCRFCSTRKLLGLTHRHCPNCGAPQDPTARYFPSDAERVAVKDHVYAGADRLCPACATPNGARANCCGNCGSPLDAGKAAAVRKDQVHAEGQSFGGETAAVARAERAAAQAPRAPLAVQAPPDLSYPAGGGNSRKGLLIAAVVVLVCGLVFAMCFWQKSVSIAVASQSWEREVQIEQLATHGDSSWCDQLPSGATDVSRSREVRSQRQVKDGETCSQRRKDNGDGTFKQVKECSPRFKDEPVYDDKCSFKITRWGYERSEKASGQSAREPPVWPSVTLTRTGSSLGAEREGTRKATYKVAFVGADGKAGEKCEVSEARWTKFAVGSKWQGAASVMTGSLDCDSLRPAK